MHRSGLQDKRRPPNDESICCNFHSIFQFYIKIIHEKGRGEQNISACDILEVLTTPTTLYFSLTKLGVKPTSQNSLINLVILFFEFLVNDTAIQRISINLLKCILLFVLILLFFTSKHSTPLITFFL